MSEIRRRIERDENWIERLMHRIPGFRGYMEMENRRDADAILRQHLAARLDKAANHLADLKRELTNQGQLAAVGEVDRVQRRLTRVMRKLRFADYGYTGFFDAAKIRAEDLDRIYEYDAEMEDDIESLVQALTEMPGRAGDEVDQALKQLDGMIRDLDDKIDARESEMKRLPL